MEFPTNKQLEELEASIARRLSPSRMEHTRRVRDMALEIGGLLSLDFLPELAAAALLHDAAKEESFEKQLHLALKSATIESKCEAERYPAVLHSYAACGLILEEYPDFATERILDAVHFHTTGKADMSLFCATLFLADYIEQGRVYEACIRMRELFFSKMKADSPECRLQGFYETVYAVLYETVTYLERKNRIVHPETYRAIEFYSVFCQDRKAL